LEADGSGRAASDPGQLRRRCRIGAGLESEGKHLVLLVAGTLCEVVTDAVKGAANDGVGAVVQRLERRYVAVQPHENHRCAGEVVRQLQRRSAGGGGGVVSSGSMLGSTKCLRKLLKKNI
jgi:hypothetical protein